MKRKNNKIGIYSKKIKTKENKKRKNKITNAQIKHLLDFKHIEELFLILKLLSNEDIEKFIFHYKKLKVGTKDKKINSMIKHSKTAFQLLESINEAILEQLNTEYKLIQDKLTQERKQGKDVLIQEMMIMNLPLKIKLFEATRDKKDFFAAKKIIHSIEKSLHISNKQ